MNRDTHPMTVEEIRRSERAAQEAREAAEKQIRQENLFQEEIIKRREKWEKELKNHHKKQEKLLMQLCRERRTKHSKDMNTLYIPESDTVITIWDFIKSPYPNVVDRICSDMRELGCEVQLDDEGYPNNDLKWVFLFRPDMLKYIHEHEKDLFCKSENH